MILIDKNKDVQILVLTLTELTDVESPIYFLHLKSDGNRTEYSVQLPANTSEFKERFDLFNVATTEFDELNDGIYTYSVLLNDVAIETGKALVKSAVESTIISPADSSEEILIYGE
jgi:hypothetical protein